MLIFYQNMKIPVLTGRPLFKYLRKNIPIAYLLKMGYLLAKKPKRVSDQFEILHTTKLSCAQKKPQNNFLVPDPVHCENRILRIQIVYLIFFFVKNIWCAVLRLVFNLSLNFIHILPAACLDWNWVYCVLLCSTHTHITLKSETAQLAISKYFCLK